MTSSTDTIRCANQYLHMQDVGDCRAYRQRTLKGFIVHMKRFMFPQFKTIAFLKLLSNTSAVTNDYRDVVDTTFNVAKEILLRSHTLVYKYYLFFLPASVTQIVFLIESGINIIFRAPSGVS